MIRFPLSSVATGLLLASTLVACTTIENTVVGEKIDYRAAAKTKPTPLDVPPDLTQLAVDPRYAPQAGVISAAQMQGPIPTAAATTQSTNLVAQQSLGDVRIERVGAMRYLSTPLTPEQLWPKLETFWKDRGLTLVVNQPDLGIMETDWAENRATLPTDMIHQMLGKVLDSAFSTGQRDKYRTRVERSARGTDVYIAQRGLEEVEIKESGTGGYTWMPRANEPLLEGEMLSRLMVQLGTPLEAAKAVAAQSAAAPSAAAAHARVLEGRPAATLQLDESFDRAWRRVGLALDRSGFTLEDRDRAQGVYFVRYVDPGQAGKEEPGFFSRMFSKEAKPAGPVRYRVSVKSEGETSAVSVLDANGAPENGANGQRIIKLLVDDLK